MNVETIDCIMDNCSRCDSPSFSWLNAIDFNPVGFSADELFRWRCEHEAGHAAFNFLAGVKVLEIRIASSFSGQGATEPDPEGWKLLPLQFNIAVFCAGEAAELALDSNPKSRENLAAWHGVHSDYNKFTKICNDVFGEIPPTWIPAIKSKSEDDRWSFYRCAVGQFASLIREDVKLLNAIKSLADNIQNAPINPLSPLEPHRLRLDGEVIHDVLTKAGLSYGSWK
jgi:hypothetical protein